MLDWEETGITRDARIYRQWMMNGSELEESRQQHHDSRSPSSAAASLSNSEMRYHQDMAEIAARTLNPCVYQETRMNYVYQMVHTQSYAQNAIREMLGWYGLHDNSTETTGDLSSTVLKNLTPSDASHANYAFGGPASSESSCNGVSQNVRDLGRQSNSLEATGGGATEAPRPFSVNGWETKNAEQDCKPEGPYSCPGSPSSSDNRRSGSRKFIGMRYLFPQLSDSLSLLEKAKVWVERHKHKYFVGWSESELETVDPILRPLAPITSDTYKLHMNRSEYCRNVKLKYCLESDQDWAAEFREKLAKPLSQGGFSGLCQAKIAAAELWRKYSENYKSHQARYPNPKSRYRLQRTENGQLSPPDGSTELSRSEEDGWCPEINYEGEMDLDKEMEGCDGEECYDSEGTNGLPPPPPLPTDTSVTETNSVSTDNDTKPTSTISTSAPSSDVPQTPADTLVVSEASIKESEQEKESTGEGTTSKPPVTTGAETPVSVEAPITNPSVTFATLPVHPSMIKVESVNLPPTVFPMAPLGSLPGLPGDFPSMASPDLAYASAFYANLQPKMNLTPAPNKTASPAAGSTGGKGPEYKKSERGLSYLFPSLADQQLSLLDKVNITVLRHKNNYFLGWSEAELSKVAPLVRPKMTVDRHLYKEYCHRNAMKYDSNLQFAMESNEPWAHEFRARLSRPPSEGGFHSLCEVKQEAGRLWREFSGKYKMHNVVKAQMDLNSEVAQNLRIDKPAKSKRGSKSNEERSRSVPSSEDFQRSAISPSSGQAHLDLSRRSSISNCSPVPSNNNRLSSAITPSSQSPSISPCSTATDTSLTEEANGRKRKWADDGTIVSSPDSHRGSIWKHSKLDGDRSVGGDHSPWGSPMCISPKPGDGRLDLHVEANAEGVVLGIEDNPLFPSLPSHFLLPQQVSVWLQRHLHNYFLGIASDALIHVDPLVRPLVFVSEHLYRQHIPINLVIIMSRLSHVMASDSEWAQTYRERLKRPTSQGGFNNLEQALVNVSTLWCKHMGGQLMNDHNGVKEGSVSINHIKGTKCDDDKCDCTDVSNNNIVASSKTSGGGEAAARSSIVQASNGTHPSSGTPSPTTHLLKSPNKSAANNVGKMVEGVLASRPISLPSPHVTLLPPHSVHPSPRQRFELRTNQWFAQNAMVAPGNTKLANDLSTEALDLSMSSSSLNKSGEGNNVSLVTDNKKVVLVQELLWQFRDKLQDLCGDNPAISWHDRLKPHLGVLRQNLGATYKSPPASSQCLIDLLLATLHNQLAKHAI